MDLTFDKHDQGTAVAHLTGRLDLLTSDNVRERLAATLQNGHPRLVVDLHDVAFIDSSGLSCLVSSLKTARQSGGDLRLARAPEQARVVLRLTTLDRVLKPYDSVEEALEGF